MSVPGRAQERVHHIAQDVTLRRGDEIHVAFAPTGDAELKDWLAAGRRVDLAKISLDSTALILEGEPRHPEGLLCLAVVPQPEDKLTAVVGIGRRGEFRDTYRRLTREVRPRVMRPNMRQHNFAQFFRDVDKHLGKTAEIHFTRVSSRRWLTREKTESSLRWTDLPFAQVFDEARQQGYFFRHVSFEVRVRGSGTDISGGLSRPNIFSMSSMAAVKLGRLATNRLIQHATAEFRLVSNRSRRRVARKPRPILATFDEPVFAEERGAKLASDRLRKYKRASIAVIHGNPYVHVRIVDHDDGSAYAVLITDQDKMTLIPQLRSSESSFSRLLEFVHDSFGDVQFSDSRRTHA